MRWYRARGRHELPWRHTRDAYAVLVSEVMLQQTQVDRVLPYYAGWMKRWPDARSLASAPTAEVIRAWAGLGYNRRALHLQRAAQATVDEWDGTVPLDEAALQKLPGVGRYTAAAVACFAGERRAVVLDTNVGRVVARSHLGKATMRVAGDSATREAAKELLPARRAARHWNLALMDLGATVCRSRNPLCGECPLRAECAWFAAGRPEPEAHRNGGVRFEDTSRFARGRIVAALREHNALTAAEIASLLPAPHDERARTYLEALERDGLAVRTHECEERWALPGNGVRAG